jgi:sulfatase maturation enzyme AslB (radical SAM superfamily)
MWNDQNDSGAYGKFAPSMAEWSAFMVEVTERWMERRRAGLHVPEIGQMRFVLSQSERGGLANIAGQTLFLMPNGDFVLPDYRDGWKEFMRPFGNILEQDFASILASPARRAYLRRQATRNGNPECLGCDHQDKCVMEFWKENREGDDCFGGSRYVGWLDARRAEVGALLPAGSTSVLY